jgi:acyl-CoA dehydrogenase
MSWDFETDPSYQQDLDWADEFVRTKVEPLDLVLGSPYDRADPVSRRLTAPLVQEVKDRRLWACHLGPELGGLGYGQVKLALLNEVLGRSTWAPSLFGCQAPDSGNAEILARYGAPEQKEKYLQPLLAGEIGSCFAMTEPQGGADPAIFTTRAERRDGGWVINGEKWFASEAQYASFFIVLAVTDPDVSPYRGMSTFLVPAGTPGLEIVRNLEAVAQHGSHSYLRFSDLWIPEDHLLGEPGGGFVVAQTRLGGGRIHHAMRTIAQVRKAFDLMCERAVSRKTRSGTLGNYQMVQEQIADSWLEIEQFRLLVLRTAWLIDKHQEYKKVRKDISAVKAAMPAVFSSVARRALHLHGSLGVSTEMPFTSMLIRAEIMGLADGPTEVHKATLAKELLRGYEPGDPVWPAGHLPALEEAARRRFAEEIELDVATLG